MALTKVSRGLLSTSIEDNGNATAITIDSSENVGIGTSSPAYTLTVKKDVDDYIAKLENDGNSTSSNGLWVDTRWNTATNTVFKVTTNSGSIDVITAKGDGKVGIGTSSPNYKLEINHVGDDPFALVTNDETTVSSVTGLYLRSTSEGRISFGSGAALTFSGNGGSAERMRINDSGELLVGRTTATGGGSVADDAQAYFNGGIIRAGVPFGDFNDVWVSLNGGIIEGRSGFGPSNAPSGAGNWFHVTAYTTFTGGTAVYATQVCTTLVGRIFTRYNPAVSTSGSWTSWVEK